MSAITKQLSTILEQKLALLKGTTSELRKSFDEAVKPSKFIDAKYDDLLKKIKSAKEE